jgi:hypothetical protein
VKELKFTTHDKAMSDIYKPFTSKGKIACGQFWVFGKDFFVDVCIWADSYDNNHCRYFLNKGNEEKLVDALKSLDRQGYGYINHVFIDKQLDELGSEEKK